MTTEKLSLLVTANTLRATTAINALQGKLRKLSQSGGVAGFFGGAGASGLQGVKMGVSGLGRMLSFATGAFGALGRVGSSALGMVLSPLKLLTRAVGWGLRTAVGVGKAALLGLGAGAAATGAAIWAGIRALGPAGLKESSGISWEVMLRSADKARQRMGFLSKFNAETPFDFQELDTGSRLMETYGIYSERNLRAIGDAVSAFGKRIEEAVGPLAKLKTGLWETESLATIGLTRDVMRGQGVKFNATGGLESSGAEAFDAAIRYFEKRFGGMMARVSKSWNGLKSTFASVWFELAAAIGDKFLAPAKGALTEMIGLVQDLTAKAGRIEVPWAKEIHTGARMLRDVINDMTTAEGRARVLAPIKASAAAVPQFMGGLAKAAAADMGAGLKWFVSNWQSISSWLLEGLRMVFRFGGSLFGEVLKGAGREVADKIAIAFHTKLTPTDAGATFHRISAEEQYKALQITLRKSGERLLTEQFSLDDFKPAGATREVRAGDVTLKRYREMVESNAMSLNPYPRAQNQASRLAGKMDTLRPEWYAQSAYAEARTRSRMGWGTATSSNLYTAQGEEAELKTWIKGGAKIGGSFLKSMTNVPEFLKSPEGLKAITAPVVNEFRARATTARESIEEPERAAKRAADLAWFKKRASRVMVSAEGRNALANAAPAAGYLKMAWRNLGSPDGGEDTARAVLDRAWAIAEEQNNVWNERRLQEQKPAASSQEQQQLDEQRQTKAAIHEVSAKIDRLADAQAQLALALVG